MGVHRRGAASDAYQKLFGIGCTRSVVAAQAKLASTRTIGDIFVQYFFNLAEPGISADRVLNGPTNDVWIDPWLTYLRGQGVEYRLNARVRSIEMDGGVVRGVTGRARSAVSEVRADYYVSALPIEVMATIVTDQVVRADPSLANIFPLSQNTAWMNGIQFYLDDDAPIGRGHQIYLDSPWALTSVSQAQFWPDVDLSRFGDGNIRGVISVDISDWETPGLNGKPARCTRREIRDEVWDQLKRSLNVQGADVLEDEDLVHWYLDLDIDPLLRTNAEPLFVNLVDTWRLRPRAVTAIRICSWPPTTCRRSPIWPPWRPPTRRPGARSTESSSTRARTRRRAGSGTSTSRSWSPGAPTIECATGRACPGTTPRSGSGCRRWRRSTAGPTRSDVDRQRVSSAMHVEDLLSYIRTGESRSELVQRLTSGPGAPSGELLRAFATLAGTTGSPAESVAASALEALASAERDLPNVSHPA